MKASIYHYQLTPTVELNSFTGIGSAREGFLIKFIFPDGSCGYSDCHPWVEFGDASLPEQFQILKSFLDGSNTLSPILWRSYRFALLDAEARANKTSLFDGYKSPQSHFIVTNS